MPGLRLQSVTRRYGRVAVVDALTLDVEDGEFLVLLGPSGSGKSTLLRLVAGIDDPSSGEIWLGERRIDRLPPRARDVAMVFQSYALYPHMSVFENLAFPLRSTGVPRAEIRPRVEEVATLLDLDDLLRRHPGQLSGGQQQRVALGRAIVRRPRLFLMDEPLSNLDAKLRARTRLELVRLHERLGVTTVYVTHDQVEAMTMGRRIAVIDRGVLHQVDTPEAVYDRPADLFVADFIGSPPLNLVPARVTLDGDAVTFTGDDLTLSFPSAAAGALGLITTHAVRGVNLPGDARDVVLGIRPEHLRIADAAGAALARGAVERVELLGHERLLHLRVGGVVLVARTPASVQVRAGEELSVGFPAAALRLFDAADGRLLGAGVTEQT